MACSDIQLLKSVSIFNTLTEGELRQIGQRGEAISYPVGREITTLAQPATEVQIILSGSVKVCLRRPPLPAIIVDILGRGEILGEIGVFDPPPHSATGVTLEPTCCLWMKKCAFDELVQSLPLLNCNIVRMLGQRLRRLTEHTAALATLDVAGRVAYQLLVLAREYGCPCPDGVLISLRLTQSDLAGLSGASREKVNRILQRFRAQRYIELNCQQHIIVRNREALAKLCR